MLRVHNTHFPLILGSKLGEYVHYIGNVADGGLKGEPGCTLSTSPPTSCICLLGVIYHNIP